MLNLLCDLVVFTIIHTHRVVKIDLCQELDDLFSCCLKNIQEDLKPLRGVSKSQVGELVVAAD